MVGGASLSGHFELEPLAMYDFNLIAREIDGSDRVLISGTRFIASRYRNPVELIDSLGFSTQGESPFAADELIMPDGVTLPDGHMEQSDSLLGDVLALIGADTLPLPVDTPRTYIVWQHNDDEWEIHGILLDSLETLNRSIAVETDGVAEIVTRFEVSEIALDGVSFDVFRTTQNWTRVFLKPSKPVILNEGQHQLSLIVNTNTGQLEASRTMSAVPGMIVREGLL